MPNEETEKHLLIFDTRGGNTPTITLEAWHIIRRTGLRTQFKGYGEDSPFVDCDVVHAITKAHLHRHESLVLLQVHHASLIADPHEKESLLTLMNMIRNSVRVNGVTLPEFGGDEDKACGITVENRYLPFLYAEEKLFFEMEKLMVEEINEGLFDLYKLNSQDPTLCGVKINTTMRNQTNHQWKDISLS